MRAASHCAAAARIAPFDKTAASSAVCNNSNNALVVSFIGGDFCVCERRNDSGPSNWLVGFSPMDESTTLQTSG